LAIIRNIIIIIISTLFGFVAGYLLHPEPKAIVKEIKVTETKYKYVPVTKKEKDKCIQSSIEIKVYDSIQDKSVADNQIKIIAGDECKQAEAIVTLDNQCKNNNIVPYIAGGFITGALTILTIIAVL